MQGVVDKRPGSDEANFIVNELIPLATWPSGLRGEWSSASWKTYTACGRWNSFTRSFAGIPATASSGASICLSDGTRVTCMCEGFAHRDHSGNAEHGWKASSVRAIYGFWSRARAAWSGRKQRAVQRPPPKPSIIRQHQAAGGSTKRDPPEVFKSPSCHRGHRGHRET